jgi:hypothetical protein
MIEITVPPIVIAFLLWILRTFINPNAPLPLPPEIPEAAKAIAANANKWGSVADLILSWNLPVAFGAGALLAWFLCALLSRRPS